MKKAFLKFMALFMAAACCITLATACTELFFDDENKTSPETMEAMAGIWRGTSKATGEWRVELNDDGTARVTNFAYDFGEYDVWVIQDYQFGDWSASTKEFDIGGYYWGDILDDGRLYMNVRLVSPDGEIYHVYLKKTTDDDFTTILDKQNMTLKACGTWEGLSNDGTYVRRLELEWARGVRTGFDARYSTEGNAWPESLSWDVENDVVTIDNDYTGEQEQGVMVNDSTMELPSVTLKKVTETINDAATISKAIGKWADEEGNTITLNADMTAYSDTFGYNDGSDKWQTVNNEVWFLINGRDDLQRVVRYIIEDNELIEFPGFAGSRRYSAQTGH